MPLLRILGIYRHPIFSNNAIEADRLILEHSIAQVEKKIGPQISVQMTEEDNVPNVRGNFDLVLTMAQREDTLATIEKNLGSSPVWNSSAAIRNCYRMNMSAALIALDVGYVPYTVLSTAAGEALPEFSAGNHWLKRSDFHAISNEDVTLAKSREEIAEKLNLFRSRGVAQVIVQAHIEGDIYKFYGVQGHFFRAIRVRESAEKFDGQADLAKLERAATVSAKALGVNVYGGDAILDKMGRFHLIDLNDWPSFRICREEASAAIGAMAVAHLQKRLKSEDCQTLAAPSHA